jgi:hypothetical protein
MIGAKTIGEKMIGEKTSARESHVSIQSKSRFS